MIHAWKSLFLVFFGSCQYHVGMSVADVVEQVAELESLLRALGAVGRGLGELAESLQQELPVVTRDRLRGVASTRNRIIHQQAELTEAQTSRFLNDLEELRLELSERVRQMSERHLDPAPAVMQAAEVLSKVTVTPAPGESGEAFFEMDNEIERWEREEDAAFSDTPLEPEALPLEAASVLGRRQRRRAASTGFLRRWQALVVLLVPVALLVCAALRPLPIWLWVIWTLCSVALVLWHDRFPPVISFLVSVAVLCSLVGVMLTLP